MSGAVTLVEVGPRDGLQNEQRLIPVADKIRLIRLLAQTGITEIEAGSFVSPKWVPQMADTADVLAGLGTLPGVRTTVLVPNMTGWEAFRSACATLLQPPGQIAVFISASEGFSRANLNCSIADSVARLAPVVSAARAQGVSVRGYVSCVTDCPFDGPVAPDAVARAVAMLLALAPMQVSLGDTIGKGRPDTVRAMLHSVLQAAPATDLAGHFHDTGGHAIDNIEAALDMGLRVFDASVGGLGGCPYAPGAPGNVATETVVSRLEQLGYDTGVDLAKLAGAADFARGLRGQA